MAVELPDGWTNFEGGAIDPDLCGEEGGGGGEIPDPVITPDGGSGPMELSCSSEGYQLNLRVTGGVAPFIWAASGGEIEVTGTHTARISIAPFAQVIAFFAPFAVGFADHVPGIQVCQTPPHTPGRQVYTAQSLV
jgi:hypothetical protein